MKNENGSDFMSVNNPDMSERQTEDYITICAGQCFMWRNDVWYKLGGQESVCFRTSLRKHFKYDTKVIPVLATLSVE